MALFDRNELHRKKIMKQLYFGQSLSLAELSEGIDKSIPLTTRILNEMVEEGTVVESGLAPSTGGRRPAMYSIRQDVLFMVSVSMDQFVTRITIMDLHNRFVTPIEKINLTLPRNPESLSRLTEAVAEHIKKSGIDREKIAGVGIGMPGFVDTAKGINYSFLPSGNKSLTAYMEAALELPVLIDNDSSVIALAELRFGAARGKRNVMVVNMGWGVGLGQVLNGTLFRGNNGFAGEFSHIPLFQNNKLCSCGKSGCLETETSLMVLIEKAKEGLAKGRVSVIRELPADLEAACALIIQSALQGDQFAVELISEIAFNVGQGIAVLIHILNPELVVLSGRGARAGRLWIAPVQQALSRYCIPRLAENTELVVSNFGSESELIGAAALVIEQLDALPSESMMNRA